MEYSPPPAVTTRILGPDLVPLHGDVLFTPGNNISIVRVGNGLIVAGASPSPLRTLSVFAPSTAAARTLQKATIPSPVLQYLDIYCLTPPVGSTSGIHSNVVVAGSISGSVTQALNPDSAEYHLGPTDLATPLGSEAATAPNGPSGSAVDAMRFRVSATTQVFNLAINFQAAPTTNLLPATVRIGLSSGLVSGRPPTPSDPSGGAGTGWLLDSQGNQCYVDVPAANIGAGVLYLVTPPGVSGYTLVQATDYFLTVMHLAIVGSPSTKIRTDSVGSVGQNLLSQGPSLGAGGNAAGFGNWVNASNGYASFDLYGSIVGAVLTGLVTVSQSLTGGPSAAQAGADLNIYAAL